MIESLFFCLILFLVAFLFFTFFSHRKFLFLLVGLFFISLGNLVIHERKEWGTKQNFEENYQSGDSYVIEINSIDNKQKEWNKVIATVQSLKNKSRIITCDEEIVLFVQQGKNKILEGDQLALNTVLEPIKNKGNPGEFDAEFFWRSKGIDKIGFVSNDAFLKRGNSISLLESLSIRSRDYLNGVLEKHLEGQELALAQALILGERSLLDQETVNAFGNSGAMHVLAVSGLHIGIILQIILFLLERFAKILTRNKALIIALTLLWVYTILSGLSASVLRATFMFSVLATAQLLGKNYNPTNGLFFTGFVLLLINPFFIYDIGFQLSFLAMIGIFWFYKPIVKVWYIQNKWLRKVWEGTAVGLAAQLLTVPLTLYYFHQFPNYFILTNIGLMLSTGVILGLGMFVFAFSWVKLLGKFAIYLLMLSLYFSLFFVYWIDELPGSVASGFQLHWGIVLTAYLLIIAFFLLKDLKIRIALSSGVFILIGFVIIQRYQAMDYNEICFFNHSRLTFTVKNKNRLYCFYDGTKADLEKVKRLVEGYRKLYPSEIRYYSMYEQDIRFESDRLRIYTKNDKTGIQVVVNEKSYYVRKYLNGQSSDKQDIEINMPWIKINHSNSYSLADKAVRFEYQ